MTPSPASRPATPKLNAVCVRDFEAGAARRRGRRTRGWRGASAAPLLGVPMTIKESFNLAGTPTTWGFPEARDYQPGRGRAGGAAGQGGGRGDPGKTNVPIALGDWQSYNEIYGVTNNPYDLAPLARRLVRRIARRRWRRATAPLSLGSDIGGSLRVPAHFCGVFAHKPTHRSGRDARPRAAGRAARCRARSIFR